MTKEEKIQSNLNQKMTITASIQSFVNKLKHMIDNELRLKKIVQKAQKIDFMQNSLPEDKLDMKHSLFVNLFILTNSLVSGLWMFSNKEYRKFKYFSIYMISLTYLGLSVGIFWEDQSFLQKISTREDAYKNQIKYLFRKQCLSNVKLQRIQHKKQLFKRLNSQFQDFHKLSFNQKSINLLS